MIKERLKNFACLIGFHCSLGPADSDGRTAPCNRCGKKVKILQREDMLFGLDRCSKCGQKMPTLHGGGPM